MYQFNKRFSLISAILCLGIVSGVDAAPSVRVLGSATNSSGAKTAGTKVSDVKTGNTIKPSVLNANTGVKKSASVKTMSTGAANMQPVARAASSRIGTAGAGTIATGANRFPGIASKTNIQKSFNPGSKGTITPSESGGKSGYNIKEMSERLSNLEEDLSKINMDNYYTKPQVDEKIDSIDTSESSTLAATVAQHTTDIGNLQGQVQHVYDNTSGEEKSVYFIADFDPDIFNESTGG